MSKKEEVIAGLVQARRDILARVKTLPGARHDEVFLGRWSVRDLLAHLVGWDVANCESVREIRAGKSPGVFKHWNPGWAAYNARLVKQYKNPNWAKLLSDARRSHRELISSLGEIPSSDFEKDFGVRSPRGRVITVAQHLQAEIDDERVHLEQIEKWIGKYGPVL